MSRGGRGGMRGGGIKGATWEHDPSLKLDSAPRELFPSRTLPDAIPPTAHEKRQVANFLSFRNQIHQGPLYTKPRKRDPGDRRKLYGEDQDNDRYAAKDAADFDPFTGVPTYTMKYDQKQRAIPSLSEQPFHKEFFPKELWDTISGDASRLGQRKRIIKQNMTEEQRRTAIAKLTENIDDNDGEDEAARDDEEQEEDMDDDYENAEGDMGGDYDAEQYFDNGEDDEDDGDGGGGDGDY